MAILHEYHKPTSLTEAIALLQRTDVYLQPLAGGSQLIGQLETRQRKDIDGVVDLRLLELHAIQADGESLHLGATATLTNVIEHATASTLADGLLRRAAQAEGPLNLRNVATVGGLVAAAEYDSEFYAALLALNATVILHNGVQETAVPLEKVATIPAHHLITAVLIPCGAARGGHARVARTPADRPIVAALAVVGGDQTRVALCGVGPRPMLHGESLNPPTDFKGSTDYRRAMAEIVVQRALANANV